MKLWNVLKLKGSDKYGLCLLVIVEKLYISLTLYYLIGLGTRLQNDVETSYYAFEDRESFNEVI